MIQYKPAETSMRIIRFARNPIITSDLHRSIGTNINGPSLIRAPGWLSRPLGKYYLYFASHKGESIRLAFSDRLEGPWRLYEPGALNLAESHCVGHIASPDVHVDEHDRRVRMYFHGVSPEGGQVTRLALSDNGIHFECLPEVLGPPYFRVFEWQGYSYALAMPGIFLRSRDGLSGFEQGPKLFTDDMRHSALKLDDSRLGVFFTNVGSCPECILFSTIDLSSDWREWRASEPITVLTPEEEYEGAGLPLEPSVRGPAPGPVRQLRDPAVFSEGGRTFLLYSTAGESGIAIAEIIE